MLFILKEKGCSCGCIPFDIESKNINDALNGIKELETKKVNLTNYVVEVYEDDKGPKGLHLRERYNHNVMNYTVDYFTKNFEHIKKDLEVEEERVKQENQVEKE